MKVGWGESLEKQAWLDSCAVRPRNTSFHSSPGIPWRERGGRPHLAPPPAEPGFQALELRLLKRRFCPVAERLRTAWSVDCIEGSMSKDSFGAHAFAPYPCLYCVYYRGLKAPVSLQTDHTTNAHSLGVQANQVCLSWTLSKPGWLLKMV